MHFRRVILITTTTLVILLFSNFPGHTQEEHKSHPVRIMFYNVENLFDTRNDSSHADEEFLPTGVMRWTITRYQKKINSIYKTIVAAGEWDPPALAAFCEVENRKTIEDLVYGTYLSTYNYGIVHEDSPDVRGIDVCLIYRKDLVDIIDYKSLIPKTVERSEFHTRSVLYVRCRMGDDTIHLFVNHWPSRRGGVLAGEDLRSKISLMVRSAADSIDRAQKQRSKIIIMGDFNCGPDDQNMQALVNPTDAAKTGSQIRLVNLADNKLNCPGTYRYQGSWETLDQMIASEWFIKCNSGLFTDHNKFKIFNADFLLVSDPKYPGQSPFSTYKGYRYQGGFSDHLPVILDLYQR